MLLKIVPLERISDSNHCCHSTFFFQKERKKHN